MSRHPDCCTMKSKSSSSICSKRALSRVSRVDNYTSPILCKKHPIQTRRAGLSGQPCSPPPASQGDPIRGLPGWPEGGRQYSHTWLFRSETNRETETVRLGDATAHSSLYLSIASSIAPSSLEIEEAASYGCCGAESLISFLWLWKSSSRERLN